jgi:hypothetical protein
VVALTTSVKLATAAESWKASIVDTIVLVIRHAARAAVPGFACRRRTRRSAAGGAAVRQAIAGTDALDGR